MNHILAMLKAEHDRRREWFGKVNATAMPRNPNPPA